MDSFFCFDTINLGSSIVYIEGPQVFQIKEYFFLWILKESLIIPNDSKQKKLEKFA